MEKESDSCASLRLECHENDQVYIRALKKREGELEEIENQRNRDLKNLEKVSNRRQLQTTTSHSSSVQTTINNDGRTITKTSISYGFGFDSFGEGFKNFGSDQPKSTDKGFDDFHKDFDKKWEEMVSTVNNGMDQDWS